MDNLNSDMSPRPDPPGSSDFVFRYIDANFDGAGTASTITTDYRTIEIFALWKGFSPQMGGNPFQRAKIFFGCRFGDFVLIPT